MSTETGNTNKKRQADKGDGEGKNDNKTRGILSQYHRLIAVMFVIVIAVFFLLPVVFILLSAVWPNSFSGIGAVNTLFDNVNRAFGVISVALGLISIWLARKTDDVYQEQKRQQDTFMAHIESYTQNMSQKIDKIMYDGFKDKAGTGLSGSSEANEDDPKSQA